jgi:hypothetical protein
MNLGRDGREAPLHRRGWDFLADDELPGLIDFHQGAESRFVAKRAKAPKPPNRK